LIFFSPLTRQNCMFIPLLFPAILPKIDKVRPRLGYAVAHDHYQVTVHFSLARSPSAMRWFVQLFRPVATTEYILIAFSRFSNPRISFFRLKVLQSTCFEWGGSKICNLFLLSAQIYSLYSNHLRLSFLFWKLWWVG